MTLCAAGTSRAYPLTMNRLMLAVYAMVSAGKPPLLSIAAPYLLTSIHLAVQAHSVGPSSTFLAFWWTGQKV